MISISSTRTIAFRKFDGQASLLSFGTDLDISSEERGIEHGHPNWRSTDICVLHTAVDATNLGYHIEVVEPVVLRRWRLRTISLLFAPWARSVQHCWCRTQPRLRAHNDQNNEQLNGLRRSLRQMIFSFDQRLAICKRPENTTALVFVVLFSLELIFAYAYRWLILYSLWPIFKQDTIKTW